MKLASFDTETHLIQPGLLAPPLVCGSTARWEGGPASAELFGEADTLKMSQYLLRDRDTTIAGANIAFDLGVLANEAPAILFDIYRAFDEERIYDVQIAQALDAIANGHLFQEPNGSPLIGANGKHTKRYSLATCVRLTLGRDDAKENDFWRLRYAILEQVPMALWPFEAVQYPKDDAWNTVEVAAVQLGLATPYPRTTGATWEGFRNLANMPEQVESAFALHLGAMWGLRTDGARVDVLAERVEVLHAAHVERFAKLGFVRADGTEDGTEVKRAVALAYGASGTCATCTGSGRVRKMKWAPCRGMKAKGRFQGCDRLTSKGTCGACGGRGETAVAGNEVICDGCDGTGLDLETAPSLPRTDKGRVSASRDTLVESGDDVLADYGDDEFEKVRNSYLPFVREGVDRPICLRPNVLVASSRTSYEGVIQLIPRSCPMCATRQPGCLCVRPCFVPRPGRLFGSTDYAAVELCTLAQCCLWVVGASTMADTINVSKDPGMLHTKLGAAMLGVTIEEMSTRIKAKDAQAKNYRQAAKKGNFGFAGGMGAVKTVLTARKRSEGLTEGPDGRMYNGIRFCILIGGARECGTEKVTEWKRRECPPTCRACIEIVENQLRPAWFEAWPEMKEYFAWVSRTVELGGEITSLVPANKRVMVRGGVGFCDGANNGFQHLAARGGKLALRRVTREAYTDSSSPLFGGTVRVPMFVHDELFTEGDADTAHLWGPRVAEVMIVSMREFVPDVHIAAETALMDRWYKDAEPVHKEGRLVKWEPKS